MADKVIWLPGIACGEVVVCEELVERCRRDGLSESMFWCSAFFWGHVLSPFRRRTDGPPRLPPCHSAMRFHCSLRSAGPCLPTQGATERQSQAAFVGLLGLQNPNFVSSPFRSCGGLFPLVKPPMRILFFYDTHLHRIHRNSFDDCLMEPAFYSR